MTKKHFEAIADYIAVERVRARNRAAAEGNTPEAKVLSWAGADACYEFALYLCNKFGERFDRQRFDAWIEKRSTEVDRLAEQAASVLAALAALRPEVDWLDTFSRLVYHAYISRRLSE